MLINTGISLIFSLEVTKELDIIKETQQSTYNLEERNNQEYQVMLDRDSIIIWDNQRWVGSIPYSDSKFDSLIFKDNE